MIEMRKSRCPFCRTKFTAKKERKKVGIIEDTKCPECDSKMIPRKSQYGTFWGCSQYPKCKGTRDANGDSKQDRERRRAAELGEEIDDVGSDMSSINRESNGVMTTFKKS